MDKFRIYFAWVFMLKAYAGLWDGAGVVRCGRRCIEYFPGYAYPYEEMAKVYYDTGHEDEIKRLLDLAEKNKIESCKKYKLKKRIIRKTNLSLCCAKIHKSGAFF